MFVVGLSTSADEQMYRFTEGVLRYAAYHPELRIAEFCNRGDVPDLNDPPPWIGKAQGILTSACRVEGVADWLRRGGVPVVSIGADLKKDFVSVFSDSRATARMIVEHLMGLDFRRFAYVGYRATDGSQDRTEALAKELARHGLSLRACHTKTIPVGTYEDFASLAEAEPELVGLIREAEKPLAVVTVHDRWAVTVCRIAEALGLKVPSDVAVVGARDLEIARISSPPISSVRHDEERIGYEATRLLHRLMRGERLSRRAVRVPPMKLVERESTVGKRRAIMTDVDLALEYIRQHACEGIRVEDVAAHVHMALRTFGIQFTAAVGRTVGEEIRQVRLERAKQLLETTDLPVSSVARLVALNSGCDLSNFFRRWTGMTPLAYRRRCHERARE